MYRDVVSSNTISKAEKNIVCTIFRDSISLREVVANFNITKTPIFPTLSILSG